MKDFSEHNDDNNGLPVSLGDILLFGSRSNMDMTDDLQDVFLDFRVDELVECFSSLSGWKYRIASMVSFLEDCASRYDMLLEDDGKIEPVCFLDFIKKQFDATAVALERCIMNLWVHLPGRCFSRDSVISISTLFNVLGKIGALLCDVDLTDEGLKRGLGCLPSEKSVCPQLISSVEKELDGARSTCLKLLKDLLQSLNLPIGVDKNWVQSYCIRNATLLFSTVSSSYRLHHMEMAPLDVLIVDEAAQVRECELVIPLRLHWVKHVVLVGDDCQLSAMVKSKVGLLSLSLYCLVSFVSRVCIYQQDDLVVVNCHNMFFLKTVKAISFFYVPLLSICFFYNHNSYLSLFISRYAKKLDLGQVFMGDWLCLNLKSIC